MYGAPDTPSARIDLLDLFFCLKKPASSAILTAYSVLIYTATVTKLDLCTHCDIVIVTLTQPRFGSIEIKVTVGQTCQNPSLRFNTLWAGKGYRNPSKCPI